MDDNNITIIETRDYPGTLAISKSILVPFQLFLLSKICKTFIITAIFCNGYWPDIDDKKENDVSLVQHFRILTGYLQKFISFAIAVHGNEYFQSYVRITICQKTT